MAQEAAQNAMPAGDAAAFERAHRALLADTDIQFDMAPFQLPAMPAWLKPLLELLASPVLKYFMWALLAVALLLVLFFIAHRLDRLRWPLRPRVEEEPQDESWRPEASSARALLQEADALAASGKYGEAARLLLFRSIEDIEARRPKFIRPALTSRDIANAPSLPPQPRKAFGAITIAVERSLFARREIDEQDWRHCRAAYEDFAFAGAWA